MSWLFSRALVEAFSPATDSDGEPSARSSGTPTPLAFCAPDRMTDFSRRSLSGTTFAPLTEDRGEELLTWFRAGFPARTSASQEPETASTASDRDSGPSSLASLARYDPNARTWRTPQLSLLGDSGESLEIWPRSGMTRGGLCWALPTLGRGISGTACGSLLPTPTAGDAKSSGSRNTESSSAHPGVSLTDWVRSDGGRGRKYSTPTAQDAKNNGAPSQHERNSAPLNVQAGGSLNPDWVEWLMGWPVGWTSLQPMDIGRWGTWWLDIGWWDEDPGEDGSVPRTTSQKHARVDRLRCTGNGQVPACAAAAFLMLNEEDR